MTRENSDQPILDLVDLCYQAIEEPSRWQTVIEKTSNLLGADAADVTVENHSMDLLDVYGSIGFDQFFRENYDEAYFGKNPWIQQSNRLPHCKAFSNEFEPEDFEKTTFYNEWLKPQGFRFGVGSTLECTRERVIHVGFIRNRSRPQFNYREIGNLDRLLPHFRRSLRISDNLRMAGLEKSNLATVLDRFVASVFLTDQCGRIVLLNKAAERLLEDGEVIRIAGNNRLALADKNADEEFRRCFSVVLDIGAESRQGDSCRFAIARDNGSALIASFAPVRILTGSAGILARCLVVIDDPASSPQNDSALLKNAYGLTDAEAKLASALAAGEVLVEYAGNHGIGVGTARWHLKNIQAKTGKRRLESLAVLIRSTLSRMIE